MTTWADLLASLREDLQDTSVTPKYSDATLYLYLCDAISDYSMWFPLRVDQVGLTGSGVGPYALPANYVADLWVESPVNRFLERRLPRPGTRFPTQTGKPFYYYMQGGSLYLNSSPDDVDGVHLTYEALHTRPANAADTTFVFSVPLADEELIRIFVKAKIMERVRTRQAALDRFKDRASSGGDRQDNPLLPEVDDLYKDYYRKISQRLGGGTIRLYRPGRIR
ncbi:MAG TPA: hypothetical protein G4O14_02820 [Anaerolineae bacterium]|nr:hypothetical protein [Anaerolineae bacterium]